MSFIRAGLFDDIRQPSISDYTKAMGLFSNTKENNFRKSEQRKRKNAPTQEEALGSVSITKTSNFPKTSKEQRKRKNALFQEEDSVDKVVEEHGMELIGCRVRVWWPLDQVFYEGHITSFYYVDKKHRVLYEDGDHEILNLTKEHWELVEEEDNASDSIQEIVPGPSDLSDSDMPLVCFIPNIRKKEKGKATDDPTPPSTMTRQHKLTPKGVLVG